jgi:GAF domain
VVAPVSEFDDELIRILIDEATLAGESMDTFIARAVAARLVREQMRRGHSRLTDLVDHIKQSHLDLPGPVLEPEVAEVLYDPERLRALYDTQLLDAGPDARFDRLADIAAKALAAPAAAVSLVDSDRQVLTGLCGIDGEVNRSRETSIERSVCQHAVVAGEPLVVEDARTEPALKDNPAVLDGTVVAYAGIPLIDNSDHAIGTLCVWDSSPRQWSHGHILILRDLAQLVRDQIFD